MIKVLLKHVKILVWDEELRTADARVMFMDLSITFCRLSNRCARFYFVCMKTFLYNSAGLH